MMNEKLNRLAKLVDELAPRNGINPSILENVMLVRHIAPHGKQLHVYPPGVVCWVQGRKEAFIGPQSVTLDNADLMTTCLPMPLETILLEASPERAALGIGILLDTTRLAAMKVKLDAIEPNTVRPNLVDKVALVEPISEVMLDAMLQLALRLRNPKEAAILAPLAVDEIYFHLLSSTQSGLLLNLLGNQGQVQLIAPAIRQIHQNLHSNIPVAHLANIANMSESNFRKVFRRIMHMPPLQYSKSLKLGHANMLIQNGVPIGDAARQVGYKNMPQFSREYRRQFGYAPSDTKRLG